MRGKEKGFSEDLGRTRPIATTTEMMREKPEVCPCGRGKEKKKKERSRGLRQRRPAGSGAETPALCEEIREGGVTFQ